MTWSAATAMTLANAPLSQQFAILCQLGITQIDTKGGQLSDKACFFLWANSLLSRLGYIPPSCHYCIMRWILADEEKILPLLSPVTNASMYRLAISDKRYVATEYAPHRFLDIKEGVELSSIPTVTFEAVIYDLIELFRQNVKRCEQADKNEFWADPRMASGMGKS